ncbi:hypothetical protein B0T16DRAFT_444311 [Cercophora newfieldiana]|uniref:Uncharacterized protein n=1 Tax=Cercophora newfieldiana TaxID=92897 RepID=A0AA39YBT7_9PEZI|nr:hypothetical protein B0T16DRAFT_444311 [Cercophora newfieldiana]
MWFSPWQCLTLGSLISHTAGTSTPPERLIARNEIALEYGSAATGTPIKPGTKLRILCVGDSITVGYGSSDGNGQITWGCGASDGNCNWRAMGGTDLDPSDTGLKWPVHWDPVDSNGCKCTLPGGAVITGQQSGDVFIGFAANDWTDKCAFSYSSKTTMTPIQQAISTARTSGRLSDDFTAKPQWSWLEKFVNERCPVGFPGGVDLNIVWGYLLYGDTQTTLRRNRRHPFVRDLENLLGDLPDWKPSQKWIWQKGAFSGRKIEVDLAREVLLALSILHFQGPPLTGLLEKVSKTLGLDLDLQGAIFEDRLSHYCGKDPEAWVGADFNDPDWRARSLDSTKMPQPSLEMAELVDLNSILCIEETPKRHGLPQGQLRIQGVGGTGELVQEEIHVGGRRKRGQARTDVVDSTSQKTSQMSKSGGQQETDTQMRRSIRKTVFHLTDVVGRSQDAIVGENNFDEEVNYGDLTAQQSHGLGSPVSPPGIANQSVLSIRDTSDIDDAEDKNAEDKNAIGGRFGTAGNDAGNSRGLDESCLDSDNTNVNPKIPSGHDSPLFAKQMSLLAQELEHLSNQSEKLRHRRDGDVERLEKQLRNTKDHRRQEEKFFHARIATLEKHPEAIVAHVSRLKGLDDAVAALQKAMNDVDARLDRELESIGDAIQAARWRPIMTILQGSPSGCADLVCLRQAASVYHSAKSSCSQKLRFRAPAAGGSEHQQNTPHSVKQKEKLFAARYHLTSGEPPPAMADEVLPELVASRLALAEKKHELKVFTLKPQWTWCINYFEWDGCRFKKGVPGNINFNLVWRYICMDDEPNQAHHEFVDMILCHLDAPEVVAWKKHVNRPNRTWKDAAATGPLCVDLSREVMMALCLIQASEKKGRHKFSPHPSQLWYLENSLAGLGITTKGLLSDLPTTGFWAGANFDDEEWRAKHMSVPTGMPKLGSCPFDLNQIFSEKNVSNTSAPTRSDSLRINESVKRKEPHLAPGLDPVEPSTSVPRASVDVGVSKRHCPSGANREICGSPRSLGEASGTVRSPAPVDTPFNASSRGITPDCAQINETLDRLSSYLENLKNRRDSDIQRLDKQLTRVVENKQETMRWYWNQQSAFGVDTDQKQERNTIWTKMQTLEEQVEKEVSTVRQEMARVEDRLDREAAAPLEKAIATILTQLEKSLGGP